MKTLFEIPYRFRITYIPSVNRFVGDTDPVELKNSILMDLRHPDVEKVEHIEIPRDLFCTLVSSPETLVRQFVPFLSLDYRLSPAMLDALIAAPKSILAILD